MRMARVVETMTKTNRNPMALRGSFVCAIGRSIGTAPQRPPTNPSHLGLLVHRSMPPASCPWQIDPLGGIGCGRNCRLVCFEWFWCRHRPHHNVHTYLVQTPFVCGDHTPCCLQARSFLSGASEFKFSNWSIPFFIFNHGHLDEGSQSCA